MFPLDFNVWYLKSQLYREQKRTKSLQLLFTSLLTQTGEHSLFHWSDVCTLKLFYLLIHVNSSKTIDENSAGEVFQ